MTMNPTSKKRAKKFGIFTHRSVICLVKFIVKKKELDLFINNVLPKKEKMIPTLLDLN